MQETLQDKPRTRRRVKRRTQEERRQESTSRLLEAAAELFARQGYDRTTFAQIAERSGYSSGLIAHRFGSKTELVNALVREIQVRTRDEVLMPALVRKSPLERMDDLIKVYGQALATGGDWLRALFVLMAESAGPLGEMRGLFAALNRGFVALIQSQIEAAKKASEVSTALDSKMLALEIVALLRGVTLLWLIDPEGVDLPAACDRIRSEFMAKLGRKIRET